MIWDEKTVQCQENHEWMPDICHQFLPRANYLFHWKLAKLGLLPHPSKIYRIYSSRFFFLRIKYVRQHQSDQDCNDVCLDSVARKEPRFLHLFTTLLLNKKYNPLPPIYYCKSDTFSVHRFIFLEKLFAGILDYFGSKLWRTNTLQKSALCRNSHWWASPAVSWNDKQERMEMRVKPVSMVISPT